MAEPLFEDYNTLINHVSALFKEGKYQEAASVLLAYQDTFPDKQYNITFNLAIIYKEMGENDKVIDALIDGNNRDAIYPIDYGSPMFSYLEDNERYVNFLAKNRELRACASELSSPAITVLAPDNWQETQYPLMIALHGGMGNNETFEKQWVTDKMRNNYIIALIQSSQVYTNGTYYWEDLKKGINDIDAMLAVFDSQYVYDKDRVTIGGFSHGGRMAIYYAYKNPDRLNKIVTLCPGPDLPEMDMSALSEQSITVITGSDDHSINFQRALSQTMEDAGLDISFIELEGMGHMFTDAFYEAMDSHLEAL